MEMKLNGFVAMSREEMLSANGGCWKCVVIDFVVGVLNAVKTYLHR